MARVVMGRKDIIQAQKLMEEHLHKVPDTEFYLYDVGWDDTTIAKAIHPKFSSVHIAKHRMDVFGSLMPKGSKNAPTVDAFRIETMARVLGDLVDKHNRLVQRLEEDDLRVVIVEHTPS